MNVGTSPGALAINPVSNEAYVTNQGDNTVTFINGATLATSTVAVGTQPADAEVDPNTYKIYISNYGDNTITMIDGNTHHTSTSGRRLGPGSAASSILSPIATTSSTPTTTRSP